MQEIPRTVAEVGMNLIKTSLWHGRIGDHIGTDSHEFAEDVIYFRASMPRSAAGMFCGQKHPLLSQMFDARGGEKAQLFRRASRGNEIPNNLTYFYDKLVTDSYNAYY